MFKQFLVSHAKLFTRLFYAAVVVVSLFLAVPVLADYIGPQRSSTELVQVRDPDNDVWTMIHVDPNDPYADVCLIIHTCDEHPSIERQQTLCGWIAHESSCEMAYRWEERVITLPEATILAALRNCNMINNWCTTAASLHLQGAEPLSGEVIIGIEGVRSGATFFAPGDTADVPLLEGSNTFSYWALSSYGDSSRMGEQTIAMDTTAPVLSFNSPAAGAAFYHNGPLTFSGSGQDAASGLAQVELSFDGGNSWQTVSLDASGGWSYGWDSGAMPDGSYLVLARATDQVGNQQIRSWATVHVDHSLPWVDLPARWMIWEELPLRVGAGGCGLEHVIVTIHGGSYGLRKFSFNDPGSWLPAAISWDRKFGQVTAPIGEYRVTVQVRDRMGNNVSGQTMLVIPAPAAQTDPDLNAIIPNTGQDETLPLEMEDDYLSLHRLISNDPDAEAGAGKPADPVSFSYGPGTTDSETITGLSTPEQTTTTSGGLLWGAAALAAAAAAVAYGRERRRKREAALAAARKRARQHNAKTSLARRLKRLWKRGLQRTQPIRNAILAAVAAVVATERLTRRKPDYDNEEDVPGLSQPFWRNKRRTAAPSSYPRFARNPEQNFNPGESCSAIYVQPLPGQPLVLLQEDQKEANICALCSIAQAFSLQTGTRYTCEDLRIWTNRRTGFPMIVHEKQVWDAYPGNEAPIPKRIYRVPFLGATTPGQQEMIINDFAEQNNLDIEAKLSQMDENELRRVIRNPDQIPIVTIAYNKDIQPTLWRENELKEKVAAVDEFPDFGAHTMVLAAYDPDMIIRIIDKKGNVTAIHNTPWGFINSWEAPWAKPEDPQSLYWMTAADFKATWGYEMPLGIGSNNVVVVSR